MKLLLIIPTCLTNFNNLIETFVSLLKNTTIEYNLMIIKNDYKGFASAINQGMKVIQNDKTYDGCILINDDVIFASDTWINKLTKNKDMYDIISCKNNINNERDHVAFWCTYISREVIDKIGILDEQFLIGENEDVDYCFRAIDAGFKINDSECEAFHKIHGTIQHLSEKNKAIVEQNKLKLLNKYRGTKWEKIITEYQ